MQLSLSALLPVRNAQSTVEVTVTELLEVLAELTRRFELVVIDDGSMDATIEVAHELPPRYPQVRVVRHARPQGYAAAIRSGLAHSRGEVLFFQDANCTLAIDELPKLWKAAGRYEVVLGCAGGSEEPGWQPLSRNRPGNYQFVRRPVMEQIQAGFADDLAVREILARLGRPWHEIRVRDRGPDRAAASGAAAMGRSHASAARADRPQKTDGPVKRPNYLTRLRDFALGE